MTCSHRCRPAPALPHRGAAARAAAYHRPDRRNGGRRRAGAALVHAGAVYVPVTYALCWRERPSSRRWLSAIGGGAWPPSALAVLARLCVRGDARRRPRRLVTRLWGVPALRRTCVLLVDPFLTPVAAVCNAGLRGRPSPCARPPGGITTSFTGRSSQSAVALVSNRAGRCAARNPIMRADAEVACHLQAVAHVQPEQRNIAAPQRAQAPAPHRSSYRTRRPLPWLPEQCGRTRPGCHWPLSTACA